MQQQQQQQQVQVQVGGWVWRAQDWLAFLRKGRNSQKRTQSSSFAVQPSGEQPLEVHPFGGYSFEVCSWKTREKMRQTLEQVGRQVGGQIERFAETQEIEHASLVRFAAWLETLQTLEMLEAGKQAVERLPAAGSLQPAGSLRAAEMLLVVERPLARRRQTPEAVLVPVAVAAHTVRRNRRSSCGQMDHGESAMEER